MRIVSSLSGSSKKILAASVVFAGLTGDPAYGQTTTT
jgi:hypothetical protein